MNRVVLEVRMLSMTRRMPLTGMRRFQSKHSTWMKSLVMRAEEVEIPISQCVLF